MRQTHSPLAVRIVPVVEDHAQEKYGRRIDTAAEGRGGEDGPGIEEVAHAPRHAARLKEVGVLWAPSLLGNPN